MRSENDGEHRLWVLIEKYSQAAREELRVRWQAWQVDLQTPEVYEVIGGVLARQVSLATQLAGSPSIWNGHIAPLVLRTMA